MVKFIPSFVTLALTAASLFAPQIQAFVTAHPSAAAGLAGVYALIKGLLPSPIPASK